MRIQPGLGVAIGNAGIVEPAPFLEIAACSASKAGLRMLTPSMAAELAGHEILVDAIAPGIVEAGMARHQLETEPQYACDYMTGSVLLVARVAG